MNSARGLAPRRAQREVHALADVRHLRAEDELCVCMCIYIYIYCVCMYVCMYGCMDGCIYIYIYI